MIVSFSEVKALILSVCDSSVFSIVTLLALSNSMSALMFDISIFIAFRSTIFKVSFSRAAGLAMLPVTIALWSLIVTVTLSPVLAITALF